MVENKEITIPIRWFCPEGHAELDYYDERIIPPLPPRAYCEKCRGDYPWERVEVVSGEEAFKL